MNECVTAVSVSDDISSGRFSAVFGLAKFPGLSALGNQNSPWFSVKRSDRGLYAWHVADCTDPGDEYTSASGHFGQYEECLAAIRDWVLDLFSEDEVELVVNKVWPAK